MDTPKARPTIALIGRTNVGKSSLWNRMTQTGRALVSPEPNTTRDRQFGTVVWKGVGFNLVDTGGMDVEKDDIGAGILDQSMRAIKAASLILFVVDAKAGLLPQDREIVEKARILNKNIWLIANKVDRIQQASLAHERDFYNLGLGEPRVVSASTSLGIGDLMDDILTELERQGTPAVPIDPIEPLKIAIVGRPNVGKSSLINAILGEPRAIVSSTAHTTREPQDTLFRYKDRDILLIDTAGKRRSTKSTTSVDEQGIGLNERAMRDADIALLVIDVTQDPTAQDRQLAGVLQEWNKGLILVANKWDLVKNKTTESVLEYEKLIRQLFPFLDWAPIVFVSATQGQRTTELLDVAFKVQEERHRHIDYNALNRLLKGAIKTRKPMQTYGPKSPRIYDAAQVGEAPPTFLLTIVGEKEGVHQSWVRFFQKRLREKFGFVGTAIHVKVTNVPPSKSSLKRNLHGAGMEAVAGKINDTRTVNQTRRRQKT